MCITSCHLKERCPYLAHFQSHNICIGFGSNVPSVINKSAKLFSCINILIEILCLVSRYETINIVSRVGCLPDQRGVFTSITDFPDRATFRENGGHNGNLDKLGVSSL